MDWFGFSLIFVVLMSAFYFLSKKLLMRKETDPRIYGGLMNLGVGLITFPVAVFLGFSFHFTPLSIGLLMAQGVVITIAASFYYTGLKAVDLSESMVLEGFQVFASLVFGLIFFGEGLTLQKVAAVICVFLSIWLVSGLWEKIRLSKYEVYILISSVFYSLGSMIDKYFVGYSNPATYLSIGFFSVGIVMTGLNAVRFRGNIKMFRPAFFRSLALICVTIAGAYYFLYRAYEIGEVSRVAVTIQSQVVLTAVLGMVFLGESKGIKRKIAALLLLTVGLYLIKT